MAEQPFNSRYTRKFADRRALSNLPSARNFDVDEAVKRTYEACNELQAALLASELVQEIEAVQQGAPEPPPLPYRRLNRPDPGE